MTHFIFKATAATEIYTLSLHDALPIWSKTCSANLTASFDTAQASGLMPITSLAGHSGTRAEVVNTSPFGSARSEEHTSELQSHVNLVCRLLLEKKKTKHLHVPHPNTKV